MGSRRLKSIPARSRRGSNGLVASLTTRRPSPPAVKSICYVYLLLVVIVWSVFYQTLRYDFVNFDDNVYVYNNPEVVKGLSGSGLLHAITRPHARNWHPVTTLSHMLDCQLFGLNAGGHHLVNVVLHTIAVLLLFRALQSLTEEFWRSAVVAALFAIHPLHVESVAWISERKDVLSAVFFMLMLIAYACYTRAPS